MSDKHGVLFLCTHKSCRSQIAEGRTRGLHGGCIEAHSAGAVATIVNTLAAKVMSEVGIDISVHASKTAAEPLARSAGGAGRRTLLI